MFNRIVQGSGLRRLLIAILVASFLVATAAFLAPAPALARPPQPEGWQCYGTVCWYEPSCAYLYPDAPYYWCTNWCVSDPGGVWKCLGISYCRSYCV